MNNSGNTTIEEIYKVTNKGLKIILYYYPGAEKCINSKNSKFKMRNEKTASASIKEEKDCWIIKDFGNSDKALNPIQLVMSEESLNFKQALEFASQRFCNGNFIKTSQKESPKPLFQEADPADKWKIEFKERFTKFELETLGPFVNEEVCSKYNLKPVKSYITDISSKTNKAWKFESTEEYPIYCFDFGHWKKIYQPLNQDKSYRFFYIGERPKNYIFGLDHLRGEVEKLREIQKTKVIQELKDKSIFDNITEDKLNEKIDDQVKGLLSDLIICSGDRDALNVASAGFNVVWLNSETANLTRDQYQELKSLSKHIYNLPDIDQTGIKQGYKLALEYLDIKTIWLPEDLRQKKDFRGNPCKDVTDLFKHYNNPINILNSKKNTAVPLRFWDVEKSLKGSINYFINHTSFYHFLKANGYSRYNDKTNRFGYVYLKINGNIVEKIEPDGRNNIKTNIKDFINCYLEKNDYPVGLRNMFYKTKQTDESSLSNLSQKIDLDFKSYDKDFQYWFFPNVAWKISKNGIEETKISDIDKFVWKSDIKDKCERVNLTKKPIFEVTYSKAYSEALKSKNHAVIKGFQDIEKYELTINDPDFIFIRFLENTSKMYWMKEKEGLSEIEVKEQKLHLINKLYALGYLAHKHKNPENAWAVFAMDAKESEIGKSFGGSGKSIYARSLEHINSTFYIGGRNSAKTEDKFIYDGVDEHTFLIIIDDADQYLKFDFFYPAITGKLNINPKNNKQFILDFNESPKFVFTSNFTLKQIDPSTERRILYTAFSDYYHEKDSDGYYKETRKPKDDLGKLLFDEFNQEEWNKFYNLMANCIQLYLSFNKISPPMENVIKRNLRTQMGEHFLGWANEYFVDPVKLNTDIIRKEVFDHCKATLPKSIVEKWTAQKFKEKLSYYCQYKGFILNPLDKCSEKEKESRRIVKNGIEYFFIEAPAEYDINPTELEMPF